MYVQEPSVTATSGCV